jgi:hypothetical protein
MKGNGKIIDAEVVKIPNHVAIVGLGPSSLSYVQHCSKAGSRRALFDETWTFNAYADVIDADMIFHMDDFRVQESRAEAGNTRIRTMLEALKRTKLPILTSVQQDRYPTSVRFPIMEVIAAFRSTYFTTTPPYSIAYGMMIGVKEFTIFGCDYSWPGMTDIEEGRGCMEYWIGRARERGIKVTVDEHSTLMDAKKNMNGVRLYGYDGFDFKFEIQEDKQVKLSMVERELPSVKEIEERYNHRAHILKPALAADGVVVRSE